MPREGAEFRIPLRSLVLPGYGQYLYGAVGQGLAFTSLALGGYALATTGDPSGYAPRDVRDQLAYEGLHLALTAGMLSAWDAFHRALPAQRGAGRYRFFNPPDDDVGDLLSAPFDIRFLGRWTTLVDLAFTAGVTTWVLTEDEDDGPYRPYRWHDAAFATSLSLNAAAGEEALFRGWLLPMLTQKLGGRFWLANFIQAGIFGLLHPQAGEYALVIGADALYSGWQTRRDGWSVREAIFQHFWYDPAVATAELLRDDRGVVTLLPITIRL
ncbi:MAG TPA: CPBP family intramembrane glutamic endopeptidase [Longimicrobiales bacterium]|nr:CPBP family intramembrane glutamic endopeptidase [Longimicrobiales bacterium]